MAIVSYFLWNYKLDFLNVKFFLTCQQVLLGKNVLNIYFYPIFLVRWFCLEGKKIILQIECIERKSFSCSSKSVYVHFGKMRWKNLVWYEKDFTRFVCLHFLAKHLLRIQFQFASSQAYVLHRNFFKRHDRSCLLIEQTYLNLTFA